MNSEAKSVTELPARKGAKKKLRKKPPYASRPFIAWDGEGGYPTKKRKGVKQRYWLFGNSEGWEISGTRHGMHTDDLLAFIIDVGKCHPNAIHVGFAFHYDVTMILRDLEGTPYLEELKERNETWYQNYKIEYIRSKWFTVTDKDTGIRVQIFDVFSFFVCSFVKALQQYFPDNLDLKQVIDGKGKRDVFEWRELETLIRPYMRLELELLVKLCERLRGLLEEIGVIPTGWHGPGAIASALLKKQGMANVITRDIPEEVNNAAQYAYFGGRFEQFLTGHYIGMVYAYDIRSAYPYALTTVPNLARGWWIHNPEPRVLKDFALYHVTYRFTGSYSSAPILAGPLPFRDHQSRIRFPNPMEDDYLEGWYWGCEVKAAIRFPLADITVHEGWEFIEEDKTDRPFAFLGSLYDLRMIWKDAGNPAQLAAKLGLNSIYGKLAQRVGPENHIKIPRWHQLEYAGYATAYCRSMVYNAALQAPGKIIAVETDGLFSAVPLKLDIGHDLGQWEYETFDQIFYVQSGVYWKHTPENGWDKGKYRGFGPGQISIKDAQRTVKTLEPITGTTKRFLSFTGFIKQPEKIAQWETAPHQAKWGGGGKRVHSSSLCPKCQGMNVQMHQCVLVTGMTAGHSHQHVLPWKEQQDTTNRFAKDEWWMADNVERITFLQTYGEVPGT